MGFFDLFKIGGNSSANSLVSLHTSRKIAADWANVESMLRGGTPAQLKQALITADKLLDNALKEVAQGQTMAERLKDMKLKIDRGLNNRMWEAHKLRNTLVHEIGFEPQHFVLREAVYNIKSVLIKIGVKV